MQLNDPKITTPGDPAVGTGRYSAGQSPDARLSVDQGNPTIQAGTGYPMCIPRTDPAAADDPLCPRINRPLVTAPAQPGRPRPGCRSAAATSVSPASCRPTGGELTPPVAGQVYCSQFVMKTPLPPRSVASAATDPDSRQQVPFEVGDHVTYSGTLDQGCGTCDMRATSPRTRSRTNIGIYTKPGSTASATSPSMNRLSAPLTPTRSRSTGWPRRPRTGIFLEAETTDVKSAGGHLHHRHQPDDRRVRNRWVTPFEMTGENQAGVPTGGITTQNTGAQPQRARLRATKAPTGLLSDPTRTIAGQQPQHLHAERGVGCQPVGGELAVPAARHTGGHLPEQTDATTANGLPAGEYTAPMFDFIFPENVKPGTPIVPNDLWHLGFLRFGEGANPITPAVGPLTPAPW